MPCSTGAELLQSAVPFFRLYLSCSSLRNNPLGMFPDVHTWIPLYAESIFRGILSKGGKRWLTGCRGVNFQHGPWPVFCLRLT